MQLGCSRLGCGHAWWRHVTVWAEGVSLNPVSSHGRPISWGGWENFRVPVSLHQRQREVSMPGSSLGARRGENMLLFPHLPLTPYWFRACYAEEKMGCCHSNRTWHIGNKVAEMAVMRCSIRMKASNWIWMVQNEALWGALSSRLATVFQAVTAGPVSLPLVQNPDQINVYSLDHCVIPPSWFYHCGWLTSKSKTDGALPQRDKAERSEYRAHAGRGPPVPQI